MCRKIILTGILMLQLASLQAAEIGIRLNEAPESGRVIACLFDTPNAFGDLRDPVKVQAFEVEGPQPFVLENVSPGEYALLVYYDENGNSRIDKNFIGIPREPLGFSNEYMPKGPPSFSRAAFSVQDKENRTFNVDLYRPLGKRGRIGVGVGVIGRSSPYRDYDGGVYQVIPAITYTGNRLQWFGPRLQLGLIGSGKLRLAATGEYRIGVYEEDGSPWLDGMGDADSTLMAGLALQAELPGGLDLSAGGAVDALGQIGGYELSVEVDKSFQYGIVRVSPQAGIHWMDREMAENDFGVSASQARPWRPAYDPGSTFRAESGIGTFIEITPDWLLLLHAGVEFLDDHATDSPIVEKSYVITGFGAVNYVF